MALSSPRPGPDEYSRNRPSHEDTTLRRGTNAPRLIVLGGTGFIGSALVATTPDSLSISGELGRSPQALRECLHSVAANAVVVHAAGSVARADEMANPQAYITSTKDLFEAIAATGSSARVLTLGSVAERLPGEGAYASMKREQRAVAQENSERLGIPWRHLLLHNVVGPAVPTTLAPGAIAQRLLQVIAAGGHSLPITGGAAIRDYLDVRDLATIVVGLSERFDALNLHKPLEICSGVGRSIHSIAAALVAASGSTIKIVESCGSDDRRRVIGDPASMRAVLGASMGTMFSFDDSISDLWKSCTGCQPQESL